MDLDSDIDLESGGTTSEENAKEGLILSDEKSQISSKHMSSDSSSVDEIHFKNKEERFRVGTEIQVVRKPSAARPPRPQRHSSLSPYDVKVLKEMYKLNLSRKKMGRMRTFNKIKRHKGSSSQRSNLWAFIVTIIFFAVIILQGLLSSRV